LYICPVNEKIIDVHKNHLNNIGMYLTKEVKETIFEKHGN